MLKRMYRRYFEDERLLDVIDKLIDVWNDKDESTDTVRGMALRFDMSQSSAIMIPNDIDHYIKEKLHYKQYGRFNDDFYVFVKTKEEGKNLIKDLQIRYGRLGYKLHETKTQIQPIKNGIDWLGFHHYITDSGKVIRKIRNSGKSKTRKKIKKLKSKVDKGELTYQSALDSYMSWRAHALKRGNSFYLVKKMDKLFDETHGKNEFYNEKGC